MAAVNQLPKFRKHKQKVFDNVISTGQFIHMIGENDALRKSSEKVLLKEIKSKDFQQKIAYIKKCMMRYRKLTGLGRGITGVQVGLPQRFAVIYLPIKDSTLTHEKKLLLIINPKITKKSEEKLIYPEICMSANPIIAPVIRPSWIEFTYYDEEATIQHWNMKAHTKEGKIYNRVIQHEIDHMDGIINIDLVQSKELIFELDPVFYEKADFKQV
jgi:peptide deformylase